ncbi:nuclear transport factor 2 family protein [Novosphingobium mangrovi (ex Huang et al. 2023)]|uniref:Nuclear transport factor 2 family protein n=1 Tax=Novosphingobium mangrovi (ex Huang et al. 2023) TaxID=2976432 RepID=A0ABT2I066_9SPHN|nr:nuclear transport factor 2 family protein [Novosphingobium mangrovi (ex Huang et al. 2023)]MCT2398189.1 nuclear transport factor 2 family protein [Novosphingobium mangrovi (ex Huang et al. 2023)]
MSTPLEARLDRIEAQTAVADLVHEYARAVRRDEPEKVASLFVPEGTFEVRSGHPDKAEFSVRSRFESPDALVAFLVTQKGGPHPIPLIHNLMVEVEGDRATANSMMAAPIYGTDKEVFGEYHDSFERRDGTWLFSRRIYTVFG